MFLKTIKSGNKILAKKYNPYKFVDAPNYDAIFQQMNNNEKWLDEVRKNFPILSRTTPSGRPLVYLDNAASTQRPTEVWRAMQNFSEKNYANIHRGVHILSVESTALYDQARARVAQFIGANRNEEIIFTKGTTESINLLAHGLSANLQANDEILITVMEHHANIVPWQIACKKTGAKLIAAPMLPDGSLDFEAFSRLLNERTKIVAITHASNSLGSINPIKKISDIAKAVGAIVVVDGAQAVAHGSVDVQKLGCDFYAFSGHKIYAPTGIGVLWGQWEKLAALPPYQTGGDMIERVSLADGTTFRQPPERFEAGTPNIEGAIGLAAALDFLEKIGWKKIHHQEQKLLQLATASLSEISGVRLIGTTKEKIGVLSFVIDCIHPHDLGTILDGEGVAIRVGHHCTQPLMETLGVSGTARASFAFYNKVSEIDALCRGIRKAQKLFV